MKTERSYAVMVVLLLCGCAQAGDILGGVFGGGAQPPGGASQGTVVAEVQSVDARDGNLQIRTDDGHNVNIPFDQNIRVVYRQEELPITALERGDIRSRGRLIRSINKTGCSRYRLATTSS